MSASSDPTVSMEMFARAIHERVQFLEELVTVLADGGTANDVLRKIIVWLDGWDMLGAWDRDQLVAAWEATGGEGDLPVVDLTGGGFGLTIATETWGFWCGGGAPETCHTPLTQ